MGDTSSGLAASPVFAFLVKAVASPLCGTVYAAVPSKLLSPRSLYTASAPPSLPPPLLQAQVPVCRFQRGNQHDRPDHPAVHLHPS